jgi:branched-chain amino acid aminotransferase
VTPIVELDRRTIGDGRPGPVTRAIQRAFFDVVSGRDARHRDWLTPVAANEREAVPA